MTEDECLKRMVAPGTRRAGKFREGVIQILVTRACDNACFGCTQGSNLGGKPMMMTVEQFEIAVKSLAGYFGVVGVFGGNPAMNKHFPEMCEVLRARVPFEQRGLWCNNPLTERNGAAMRATFNPRVSNLNCHMDRTAYENFKKWWPESVPFGVDKDSRHAPVHLAMRDVLPDEGERWDLISTCDINQHWSALIGVFRGSVRAWFCEVAGAQAMLHEHEADYPDTGTVINPDGTTPTFDGDKKWWQFPMKEFAPQVRKHCHECGVPLRGHGALAVSNPNGTEQTSATHKSVFVPKRTGRAVEIVTKLEQLGTGRIQRVTDYVGNAKR